MDKQQRDDIEPAQVEPHPHEIVRCIACGRTLTDEDSRRRRIGPDCAAKLKAAQEELANDGYDPDEVD